MRVLHIVPSLSPSSGGPLNALPLVRFLNKHGIEATVLTTDADVDGHLDVPLGRPTITDDVTSIFHHAWPVAGRWKFAPSMVGTLRAMVGACDLVHIHWLFDFSSIAAARAALAAGVPFVIEPHGSLEPYLLRKNRFVKRAYMATVGRPLLGRAGAVIFTAEQERRAASYHRRRPEWTIPVGLDLTQFDPLPPAGAFRTAFPAIDGPFLLFLGRLSPQKGLDLLLEAFRRILASRPDLWLVIAGPDYRGYEAQVRSMAGERGIEHRVLFTGLLPHDLKLAAFVDAELFVLPSYVENFGVAIVEALACGLPVVISDQVGIHQELAAAGAATVVTCDATSLTAGVRSALTDTDLRRRMATLGPAIVRERYTWDAIVPMLIGRYRELVHA